MQYLKEILGMIWETLGSIFRWFEIKTLATVPLIPAFHFLFGSESERVLTALTILVAFDYVTGVWASKKLGHPIESKRSFKTVLKLMAYGIISSSTYLTESIVPGSTYLDLGVYTWLALTELVSIVENYGKMGYAVPQKLLNQIEDLKK